ncbi:RagB/SusD family nutrient uptake outer membrane protein [Phnomibacter sp. MR]|uniref:RagB/SusD family nutrient uptake outer membrane protein n=1 Tax=Phnomibacter sp. MR TaxID=3042318 RepID=UPI003A8093BB
MTFKKYISILLLMAIATSGCRKFLEQEPYNRLSVDDIFKDVEGARTTLIGCYDNLKETGHYLRNFGLYADIAGGNIKYGRATVQPFLNTYNFTNTNAVDLNDLAPFYQVAYNTIYRANNILEYINKIADATQPQRNFLMAEAYSLRALSHFDLVRVFAQPYNFTPDASHKGIVYRRQNTGANVVIGEPATVKEVYTQLVSDLDSARLLYKNGASIYAGGNANSYMSYNGATALLCRVMLYMQNWSSANALATELISSNQYGLISNGSYVNSWQRAASPNMDQEAIFLLFARTDVNQSSYGENFVPNNTNIGNWVATTDLLNLYEATDVRSTNSMYNAITTSGVTNWYTKKYNGINSTSNNQKIIRISEVWLNRAEARAQADDLTGALSDLNRIRQRGNAAAPALALTNKQQVLDSIFVERRRELCFEGHLLFDIVRQKRNLIRNDCTGANCSIIYPSPLFVVPIPTQR